MLSNQVLLKVHYHLRVAEFQQYVGIFQTKELFYKLSKVIFYISVIKLEDKECLVKIIKRFFSRLISSSVSFKAYPFSEWQCIIMQSPQSFSLTDSQNKRSDLAV